MVPKGEQQLARNSYSTKPWKDVRKDKIINCPTDDPIFTLLGAILKGGLEEEGAKYFNGSCNIHSDKGRVYCGSYWTDIAGVDYTYIKRMAKYGVKK